MAANVVMFATIVGIMRFFGDGDEYFGYNQFSLWKKVCFCYESPWFGSDFYYFLVRIYEKPKNVTRYRVSSVLLACTSLNYQLHTHS